MFNFDARNLSMTSIAVKIVAFGITKELLGDKHIELIIPCGTIESLRQELINKNPKFSMLPSLRFAVNDEFVENDFNLNNQDEVVLIPPVSGG